jgi:hypothetical protein
MAAELTWDDFLTEQDRQHLAATWRKTEPNGFGSRPAAAVEYFRSVGTPPLAPMSQPSDHAGVGSY